jgi:hypothetical protein
MKDRDPSVWVRAQTLAAANISLRDWFAGQALVGLCANPNSWEAPPADIARWSVEMADDMLRARGVEK